MTQPWTTHQWTPWTRQQIEEIAAKVRSQDTLAMASDCLEAAQAINLVTSNPSPIEVEPEPTPETTGLISTQESEEKQWH